MYHEYKQKIVDFESQKKQVNQKNHKQTLDDILSDDVIAQSSSKKNEFTSYQRQD
jgi:isocitrate dehydrogenase